MLNKKTSKIRIFTALRFVVKSGFFVKVSRKVSVCQDLFRQRKITFKKILNNTTLSIFSDTYSMKEEFLLTKEQEVEAWKSIRIW